MKIFRLPELAESSPESGFLLGGDELATDAVYLDYRRLPPHAPEATVSARQGYELVVYVVKGSVRVKKARSTFEVNSGEAFCPNGEVLIENPADEEAVFLVAGGRGRRGDETAGNVQESPDPVKAVETGPLKEHPAPESPAVAAEEDGADFIITADDPTEDGLR